MLNYQWVWIIIDGYFPAVKRGNEKKPCKWRCSWDNDLQIGDCQLPLVITGGLMLSVYLISTYIYIYI